mmetsp:Transcript_20032/g.40455  ORF Transcript_20032/g.40455 Transcript_20032/m.40455 type:complete len:275 (+) Transcript_20032:32-856(+)
MFLSSNWKTHLKKAPTNASRKRKRSSLSNGGGDGKGQSSSTVVQTAIVAMDCEMVGVGRGGRRSILARCSIVNYRGEVLYDKFVKPMEPVTDYRTHVSGIRPRDINGPHAIPFRQCQQEVAKLLERRTLVGHSVDNDLKVLLLSHPKHNLRDTAFYKPLCPKRPKALKKLVKTVLGRTIQTGEHSSVEDARCTLDVYKAVMDSWEKSLANKRPVSNQPSSKKRKNKKSELNRNNTTKVDTITEDSDSLYDQKPIKKKGSGKSRKLNKKTKRKAK